MLGTGREEVGFAKKGKLESGDSTAEHLGGTVVMCDCSRARPHGATPAGT